MKNLKNKAVGLIVTTALLTSALLPTACNAREARDIEKIQEISQQFIDTFSTGDKKAMNEIVEEDYYYRIASSEYANILFAASARTEIETIKSVEINRERNTARVRMEISYLNLMDFSRDYNGKNSFMTEEEYLEAIEKYKDLDDANFTLNFKFDEDEDRWLIKENSAGRYEGYFNCPYYLNVVKISPDEAMDEVTGIYSGLAEGQTVFDDPFFDFDPADIRVFDDGALDSKIICDAAAEFTKAYFKYITDHGIAIETQDGSDFDYVITGYVPSSSEILKYFSTDEYYTEIAMAEIRSQYGSNSDVWDEMYAGIYYDLAKRIPDMTPEEYVTVAYVDPWADVTEIVFLDKLFPISVMDVVWASDVTQDQKNACRRKAAESLYLAGELTEKEYKSYLDSLENSSSRTTEPNTGYYGGDVTPVFWQGTANYVNQAVNVVEEVPSWSTDNSIIYGTSMPDQNGIYMHYTKEPGWEDTAGYCLATEGIVVMVKFDHKFAAGTVLEYDWYINEEPYGETQKMVVNEDGTVEFEFMLEGVKIPQRGSVSFRLWEEGHTHVISYVVLTQT